MENTVSDFETAVYLKRPKTASADEQMVFLSEAFEMLKFVSVCIYNVSSFPRRHECVFGICTIPSDQVNLHYFCKLIKKMDRSG